jgi:hypothetical protein
LDDGYPAEELHLLDTVSLRWIEEVDSGWARCLVAEVTDERAAPSSHIDR